MCAGCVERVAVRRRCRLSSGGQRKRARAAPPGPTPSLAVGLLEGLSLQQSAQKLQQAFLPTFKARGGGRAAGRPVHLPC